MAAFMRSLVVVLVVLVALPLVAGEPCTASGVYKVNGKETKLAHAYIHAKENPFDKSKVDAVVLLTADAIPEEEASDVFALMRRASAGNFRGIEVRIDDEGDVISGQMYHDGFAKMGGSFSATGMHKFASDAPAGSFGGTIGTGGDNEFSGVTWSYDATFRCPKPAKGGAAAPPAKPAGKALPAGGGDPGKTYLALWKAVKAGDMKSMKALVSADRAKQMDDPEFKEMFPMIQAMQAADVKVTGGSTDGSNATLTVTGSMDGTPAKGKVTLVLEGKVWKVEKESWSVGGD